MYRLLVPLLAVGLPASAAEPARPDVVLFLTDDLGWADCSPYGGKDVPTPNMARLARDGMTFAHAFVASPSCAPSRAALLTGLDPMRNGAMLNHSRPKAELKKWPAYFKQLGYEVVAFGKVAHYAQVTEYGFDHASHFKYHEDDCIAAAVKWLEVRKPGKPLCLLVGTNWPHVPWPKESPHDPDRLTLPPTFLDTKETRQAQARYLAAVANADRDLGLVYDAARKHLGTDTLFVFTADHGAQFPFGKWNAYDAGVRTPLIAAWPGRIKPGTTSAAMVNWTDLLPTCVEAAGGELPDKLSGRSFLAVLRGEKQEHWDKVFVTHSGDGDMNRYPLRAVRTRDWKYIRNLDPDAEHHTHIDKAAAGDGRAYWDSWTAKAKTDPAAATVVRRYHTRPAEELYDLTADPWELKNLASDPAHAGRLKTLRADLDAWMKDQGDEGLRTERALPDPRPKKKETPAAAADRPNFVFLFADDQRYDALSVVQKEQGEKGRFPWFKTPNMDRLAAEGVRFRNAFVVNAPCSPSRACFLSGRYNHANGIWNNRTPLSDKLATHASLLRAEGYSTGYVGKWHMGTQPARPGFDWSASFTGQGTYTNANFLVNGQSERADEWTDDRSAGYAIQFLEKGRAKDKPFLLVVGFKAPHGPFEPPKRLANAFADEQARRVPNLGLPPGFNPELGKRKEVGEKVAVNLNYFRCIAGVDENVGKVLDALDRLDLTGNTVVVYGSDNGFYLGEHTLADKRSGYDESLRIPLIVRYPKSGLKGVTRDDLVLNIDLAPTFLDLAGVAVPKDMHGKSWKQLLAKETPREPFRASFLYEYFRENGPKKDAAPTVGGYNTPTMTGVRTATHKLLRYRDRPEWSELFDLAADPYETKNLFADAKHTEVREKLEQEHDRLVKELGYTVPADVPAEPKR